MIKDYSVYELSGKERLLFYSAGYVCIFIITYLFYHSLWLSVPAGATVHWTEPYFTSRMAQRRMNELNMQFKDLLYSLSASVASGRQMDEALIEAEEELSSMYGRDDLIMKELRHMRISMVENKESDKVLLRDLAVRSGSEDITDFVQVYIPCRNIDREIRTITSQKKVEGRLISAMPLIMLMMLNIFSFSYIEPLYATLMGRILMTGALIASVYGVYLMEKISDIKV